MKTFPQRFHSKRGVSLIFLLAMVIPLMTVLFCTALTRVEMVSRQAQIEVVRAQARLLAESARTLSQRGAKPGLTGSIEGIGKYALVSDGRGGVETRGHAETVKGIYQVDCTLGAKGYQYSLHAGTPGKF